MLSEKMYRLSLLLNGVYDLSNIQTLNDEQLDALTDEINDLRNFVNSVKFLNEMQVILNKINRYIESQKLQAA